MIFSRQKKTRHLGFDYHSWPGAIQQERFKEHQGLRYQDQRPLLHGDLGHDDGGGGDQDNHPQVGTAFLWVFWPSFNTGAAAEGDAQMRALINTYLALCASCMAAFAISALVNPQVTRRKTFPQPFLSSPFSLDQFCQKKIPST